MNFVNQNLKKIIGNNLAYGLSNQTRLACGLIALSTTIFPHHRCLTHKHKDRAFSITHHPRVATASPPSITLLFYTLHRILSPQPTLSIRFSVQRIFKLGLLKLRSFRNVNKKFTSNR